MSVAGLAAYLGGAALYAVLAAAAVLALWRRAGRRVTWDGAGLALATGFVVFLALSPFPDPARIDCAAPRLRPFNFLDVYAHLLAVEAPLARWLTSPGALSPVMNVVFFLPVGIFLARLGAGWGPVGAAALALTLAIELTQLTGIWGIYPCAYRTFDVDDLMLNTAGVLAGAALALRRRDVT